MGVLAQSTFTQAICSCTTITASNTLTTDGFNSANGPPDGGLGGGVGSDQAQNWSNKVSIGGNLQTPGNLTSSATSVVRGNLLLGGTATASATLTVDGNASVVKTLPSKVVVDGTTTKVSAVAAPCDCTNVVPIASIVSAHATSNDNATIGLSTSAATGSQSVRIDLPCGNYYLSQINVSAPLTIWAHGHTALYIGGDVTASNTLTIGMDASATLDLFIAGNLTTSNTFTLGSTSVPAQCRTYMSGSSLDISGAATLGCNLYAPSVVFDSSAVTAVYGSLFVNSFTTAAATTVHYDQAILSASNECCSAQTCDDGNPCTVDSCNGDGTCSHAPQPNGTSCTGSNLCEQTYTCQAGVCTGSNPVVCSAGDQCHAAGTCNPATGTCSNPNAPDGTSCNDGNACTQTDTCQSGTCSGSNPVSCTAEDQCHVAGTCDPSTGQCSNPAAANGATCNDGNACTQSDSCQGGACVGSNPVTCAASDQCHVAGVCDPSSGTCSNPASPNGSACTDGNACTQVDSCQAGVCVGSNAVTCTASDQCHVAGACNPSTGTCSNPTATNGTACSDGNACDLNDTCQAGVCTAGSHVTCTASDQCHTAGTCNPSTGQCSNPTAPNGTTCSDGNACDLNDTCQAGVCTAGSHVTCTASDQCHTAGTCNPSTGTCSNPTAANGTACNDGNACTQSDTCVSGTCTGSNPVTCSASDQCHSAGTCDPGTGTCSNPASPNGTACSDGNSCTQTDACQNGSCTGSNPVTCTAQDQCHTAGTCNPSTGTCSNPSVADGTTCVGSNKCDQTYACTAGVCVGSNPVTCTAQDQCHVPGTCDPGTGTCSNPTASNGTACNDGNACTQTDACQSGSCVGSNPVTCAATQCQSAGTCNPATGTCSGTPAPDGTICTGTNLCNQAYACAAGQCVGSNPVTCTPSDQCHVAGTCDPNTGACSNPAAANGTGCNDGNACTQSDSCQSGACLGSNPVTCSALDACHVAGTCSPTTGTCSNPDAPNGTACGTTDGGQALVCTTGTCGAQTPCNPSQTLCKGVCVSVQSDPLNCGSCANVCPSTYSCVLGNCVSPAVMHSCLQSSSVAVQPNPNGVTMYVPRGLGFEDGNRFGGPGGVTRVVFQGKTVAAYGSIPTPLNVNSCATNWVTGQGVCVSSLTDVYLINGNKLTATLTDGATGYESFSGGNAQTGGVTIDAASNTAVLSVGLSFGSAGSTGGYQFLNLNTNTFSAPVSAGFLPAGSGGQHPNGGLGMSTSEAMSTDPFRHLLMSPNEQGDFQLVTYSSSPSVADNFQLPPETTYPSVGYQDFETAAEDCSTGITLLSDETNTSRVTLVDLSQSTFSAGSPNGTWSAPNSLVTFNGIPGDLSALTVAPGTHLGFLTTGEGSTGGATVVVVRLPSAAGNGTPSLVDWAAIPHLHKADGSGFDIDQDPHPLTSYVDPLTGRALTVLAVNYIGLGLAIIDMEGVLDAPRVAGTNLVDPNYDLIGTGVTTFITPCNGFDIFSDPNNCGGCGNACPAGANAIPVCNDAVCGITCEPGYANCSNSATTCANNLASDASNCGRCGNNCAAPNGTGACNAGQCTIACNQGYSDCDGNESNGCETQGSCAAPRVAISGPTSVAAGTQATYTATASGPGLPLAYAWTAISGPGTVSFGSPAALTTTAEFPVAGTYVLQFEASDTYNTSATTLTVSVNYVNRPPVVTAGANQTLTAPTMTTTLTGSATDDGLPTGATLSTTWSLLSGPTAASIGTPTVSALEPGPVTANTPVTFSYPGTYVFELDANDSQLDASATTTVTVNSPAAPSGVPPTVQIGGVADDQEITKPTSILGTVSDGAWLLQYRLGGRDDVQTPWTKMASGVGPLNAASIATFDPTLLLNGIYTVMLTAQNSAGSAATSVSLSVDARMKLGNFTLTFTDLDTVVATLPLTITRTYDSRDKTIGDFGYGWHLGLRDVRVEKSGKIGAYWYQQFNDFGILDQFCLYPSQAATVAVTFPNGRQYRFTAQSSPQCQYDSPLDAPDVVWTSTSDPNNPTIQLGAGEGTQSYQGTPVTVEQTQSLPGGNAYVQLTDLSTGNIWDPRQFTLTTEDGTVWQIDQDLGVTSVKDRNGNTLTINQNGIVSSSGKQVVFTRDAKNRITNITDPNGKSMTYTYDKNGDLATFTDRASNVTQFAYQPNHYLSQIQDPLGRLPVRNEYDTSGRLTSTTDAAGNTVHYTPNLAANQEQVTDRLGHVTLYTYNDRGDITQKVDATGAAWNYTFDPRGNQLTSADPLGHVTTSTYDNADDLLTQTDALGNKTTNTYNAYRQLLTSTDPLGHVTTNAYDGSGNLLSTIDAVGNVTHYTYDDAGNRRTETDPLGNVTQYQYDTSGHVTQTTDPRGNQVTYKYDSNGNKTREDLFRTNYNGTGAEVTKQYTYDAMGRLTQTQGLGFIGGVMSATTYTPTGKRATTTDALNRVTTYTYDALDRLKQTQYPDGTITSQTYDAENHRVTSTDAAGNTTTYVYDGVGHLTRTIYADGSATTTVYDPAGRATQAVDELGHVHWSSYDGAGRLATTTDPLGNVTQYGYDGAGNRTSVTDPLGNATTYIYDADNRPTVTIYADGTAESTQYDAAGRASVRADGLGHETRYGYDSMGHLQSVTDALGHITQYTYDEVGSRISQQDANNHLTTFYYDFFTNLVTARYLPGGAGEHFTIDHAGETTQHTDFIGRTTTYAYDPLGRVLSRTYPDSSVVSFTYTPTGQRQTATDARGITIYGYDSRNRLAKLTYPDGRVLTYGYDDRGDRTTLTAKIGNTSFITTTGYDADERPSTVTDPLGQVFTFGYDAASNRKSAQYPNGTSTSYGYDPRNRVTNIAVNDGSSIIDSFAYVLDDAGRRTQVTEADGTVRVYGYDSVDRLTSESVTGSLTYAKAFTYDPVGNRLTQITTGEAAASVTYAYDSRDRLSTENGTTYGYDTNGNVTSKSGEATYGWDFDNRLTSATMSSGTVVAHQYDPDGSRVQTGVTPTGNSSAITNYLVETAGCPSCGGGGGLSQVVAETDGNANITAVYVWDQAELLEVMRPGASPGTWTTRFVHADGLGSVRALTDEIGTTTDTRAYEAFGTKNVEAGSDLLTYGFAGEPFQSDSMLAYHRARWMDARVGRFVGMDRVDGNTSLPTTLHRYIYGSDEPTDRVDPTGNDDMVSEPSFRTIVSALTNTPSQVVTGNIPNPANSYWEAVSKALSASLNLSLSTYARASDQAPNDKTPLHPEEGGFVFEALTPTGPKWGWTQTRGAADMIDWQSQLNMFFFQIPEGAVAWAVFHTHPNDGLSYVNTSGDIGTFQSGEWSCGDARTLDLYGRLSQNPSFIAYVAQPPHQTLSWQYGFSYPDVGTYAPDKPCPMVP